MHLHNYAWNLALTTTELRIISKALAGDDLTEEEEEQAEKLAGTIRTIYAVKRKRPKFENRNPGEENPEDTSEDEPVSLDQDH
jgi:hypothetical protein